MTDRILVAYSTAAGSTAGVAEAIGQAISGDGVVVDVLKAKDVRDLSPYRAVIVGSGIHAGRVYRDTLAFLERHQGALSRVPVAYFVVCLTMKDGTDENRRRAEAFVDQMRAKAPQVQPVDVGLFAGQMEFKAVPFLLRLIIRAMKAEEGDFRDWDAIREWAASVRPALLEWADPADARRHPVNPKEA
jgi:menaquinone-dependent protoporphyrinogen oxidase